MSSHTTNQHPADVDSTDEYPQVTQADLDRATFRVGLQLAPGEEEIERIKLANSKKLRLILDEAEARIRATGGIRHEDFWNQLDAEYQDVEADSQAISAGAEKKGRTKSRSAPQPILEPIPMPAIAEPKADYTTNAE